MSFAPKRPNALIPALAASVLCLSGSALFAAEVGDIQEGERFAKETCASCHATGPGATTSPVAEAPTFQAVADSAGMNRRALIVFFRTPHKNMPNLVIQGDEADDIIAYILSLKSKN